MIPVMKLKLSKSAICCETPAENIESNHVCNACRPPSNVKLIRIAVDSINSRKPKRIFAVV